jgi:Domain of unknown function (DUF4283)
VDARKVLADHAQGIEIKGSMNRVHTGNSYVKGQWPLLIKANQVQSEEGTIRRVVEDRTYDIKVGSIGLSTATNTLRTSVKVGSIELTMGDRALCTKLKVGSMEISIGDKARYNKLSSEYKLNSMKYWDTEPKVKGLMGQSTVKRSHQSCDIKYCRSIGAQIETQELNKVRDNMHKGQNLQDIHLQKIPPIHELVMPRQDKTGVDLGIKLSIDSIALNAKATIGHTTKISEQQLSSAIKQNMNATSKENGPKAMGLIRTTEKKEIDSFNVVDEEEFNRPPKKYLGQQTTNLTTYPKPLHTQIETQHLKQNKKMNISDEELVAQFASPQAGGLENTEELELPSQAYTHINWEHCAVARVLSDKMIMDAPFKSTMARVWQLQPTSFIRPVARNTYIVQFSSMKEMCDVVRGIWAFRNDVVALKQAHNSRDLTTEFVDVFEAWVQLHNIPTESVTQEGILHMMRSISTPMTEVQPVIINSKQAYKARLLIPINKPLKDRVMVKHPILGRITALVVYERVARACLFCGLVGHEIADCPSRLRLARIKFEGTYNHLPQMNKILEPKVASWIVNAGLIPDPSQYNPKPNQPTQNSDHFSHAHHGTSQQQHTQSDTAPCFDHTSGQQEPNRSQTQWEGYEPDTQRVHEPQTKPNNNQTDPIDLNDNITQRQPNQHRVSQTYSQINLKRQMPYEDQSILEINCPMQGDHIAVLMNEQATLSEKQTTSTNPKRVKAADPKRPPIPK